MIFTENLIEKIEEGYEILFRWITGHHIIPEEILQVVIK